MEHFEISKEETECVIKYLIIANFTLCPPTHIFSVGALHGGHLSLL